jgi:hypothetical protein
MQHSGPWSVYRPTTHPRGRVRAVRIIGFGFVLLLVVAGVVGFLFRDKLSGSVENLQVGDCFEVPAGDTVEDVQHRPCTEPHDGEVFVVRDYSGSDTYPSTGDFDTWASEQCTGTDFEAYVGDTYDSRDDVGVGYLYPLEEGWGRGDREMTCYLSPTTGGTVSVSYRAAGN